MIKKIFCNKVIIKVKGYNIFGLWITTQKNIENSEVMIYLNNKTLEIREWLKDDQKNLLNNIGDFKIGDSIKQVERFDKRFLEVKE